MTTMIMGNNGKANFNGFNGKNFRFCYGAFFNSVNPRERLLNHIFGQKVKSLVVYQEEKDITYKYWYSIHRDRQGMLLIKVQYSTTSTQSDCLYLEKNQSLI